MKMQFAEWCCIQIERANPEFSWQLAVQFANHVDFLAESRVWTVEPLLDPVRAHFAGLQDALSAAAALGVLTAGIEGDPATPDLWREVDNAVMQFAGIGIYALACRSRPGLLRAANRRAHRGEGREVAKQPGIG